MIHGCITVGYSKKLPNVSTFVYPTAYRDETIIDDYHGIKVADPYRWLERLDTLETQQYMNELNAVSEPFLAEAPNREQIRKKLNELNDYERFTSLGKKGDFYYYRHNKGLQNQDVIFRQKTLVDDGDIFLDPSDLSADGTASLGTMSWSMDGSILAYVVSEKGSDVSSIRFRDVHKHDLADIIENVKFTYPSWLKDNSGIFYSAYQSRGVSHSLSQKDENQTIYFHRLGTDSTTDKLIYGTNLPIIGGYVTNDGKYLMIHIGSDVSKNILYYYDLSGFNITREEAINPRPIFDQLDGRYVYIDHDNDSMLILTNREAPNYKIIRVFLMNGSVADVVPEDELSTIVAAYAVASNRLLIQYLKDVKHTLQVHDLQSGTHLHTLSLMKGSRFYDLQFQTYTIADVVSKKSQDEVFFTLETMITPAIPYRMEFSKNISNPKLERLRQGVAKGTSNEDEISVQQVFYSSKDGTKIPMYIISSRNKSENDDTPVLLEGYGVRPMHQFNNDANHFRLAITGVSNGGLLVAVCAQQRPDLYGAIVGDVGVYDMLRYHKFTIGAMCIDEFGNPDKAEDFKFIYNYSPLHNIRYPKRGQWPSTLMMTADHDDRAVPSHTLKYAATLYDTVKVHPQQTNPLLFRIEHDAGHGFGKPLNKQIAATVDVFSFLQRVLKLEWKN
ncbi:unnamed protein product [Cylicocyclus nassatus]|uniref:Prolyl endopeptidase n=1 Tax=Cylicocyclus nassatus TaxID=53992 RepID=A0AA36M293_CYLNA|nr:unnamed protein product [Cylicocyclus nassatus]